MSLADDPAVTHLADLAERLQGRSPRRGNLTSGAFRRSADATAAGFDDFQKNADELTREIGGLILEFVPGVGEFMSAKEAAAAFTDAYEAIQRGDLDGAREQLGNALFAAAAAIPIAGKAFKIGKVALEIEHIAFLAAKGAKKVKGRAIRTFNQPRIDDLAGKIAPERKLPPKVRAEVEGLTARKDALRKQKEAWERQKRTELKNQGSTAIERELRRSKRESQDWRDLVAEGHRNDLEINKRVGAAYEDQMALHLEAMGYKTNRKPESLSTGAGVRKSDTGIEGRGRERAFVETKSKTPRPSRKGESPSRPDPPELSRQMQREAEARRIRGLGEKSVVAIEGKEFRIHD